MDTKVLSKPLEIDQVDFRVQSINGGGYATILAYKDARVDMNRLNSAFGVGRWQRKHESINGNLFCSVGVWNDDIKQWAWVQDVGVESQAAQEKGQASDSFKRACFNLGIGIELYSYPVISIKLDGGGDDPKGCEWYLKGGFAKPGYNLKLKEWTWFSQFTGGKLTCLAAKDQKGRVRFNFGQYNKEENKGSS